MRQNPYADLVRILASKRCPLFVYMRTNSVQGFVYVFGLGIRGHTKRKSNSNQKNHRRIWYGFWHPNDIRPPHLEANLAPQCMADCWRRRRARRWRGRLAIESAAAVAARLLVNWVRFRFARVAQMLTRRLCLRRPSHCACPARQPMRANGRRGDCKLQYDVTCTCCAIAAMPQR